MARPGVEAMSPGPLANTKEVNYLTILYNKCEFCVDLYLKLLMIFGWEILEFGQVN